jgi:hypothetical protein
MLVAGPAAQYAPQGRKNAAEPGRATEYTIEESNASVPGFPHTFQVRHFRSQQTVKAEGDQQQADTCSQVHGRCQFKNSDACGNSDGASDDER